MDSYLNIISKLVFMLLSDINIEFNTLISTLSKIYPSQYTFYQQWSMYQIDKHSLYNGVYKSYKYYILQEYIQRCILFKGKSYPTFFEKKYPMRFRKVLQQLTNLSNWKYNTWGQQLYMPIGYYYLNFQYNIDICLLDGLKHIHCKHE